MKKLRIKPSFISGFLAAVMLFAFAGGALAVSGNVSFNTVWVEIGEKTVAEAGESLYTQAGAEIPSVILYTDELGGETHYMPIRQLAETLHLPLVLSGDTIYLIVSGDLETYTLPSDTSSSAVYDKEIKDYPEAIIPDGGKKIVSVEHESMENYKKALARDSNDGRFVTVTIENNGKMPLQFNLGYAFSADLSDGVMSPIQVPAGESFSRTYEIILEDGETNLYPYIEVGNAPEVSRLVQATINVVQFDN